MSKEETVVVIIKSVDKKILPVVFFK